MLPARGDTEAVSAASGPRVVAVSRSDQHLFSKPAVAAIELVAGVGVAGDAHAGATVRHRSAARRDPTQPNRRQVHLIGAELLDELGAQGFAVAAGELGENVTTRGVDLLALPERSLLRLGGQAEVELTGLRNPCAQINDFRPGLLPAVLGRDPAGRVVRRAGVMGVVRRGGRVVAGDPVVVVLPDGPHQPLGLV